MSPTLRRHGTTLAMVALALGGLVVVFVQDRGAITTGEREARRRNLLPAFRDDEVSELRVTVQGRAAKVVRGPADPLGQRARTIEIDGKTAPVEEPAVDQLMASLRDGVVDHWVEGAAEQVGEARAMIAVDMGRQRYRVTLRGPAPSPAGGVYVEVEGGDAPRTGVITAQLAAVLTAPPDRMRQRALVSWGPADLASLALDGEGGPRHLVRAPWPALRGASFRFDGSTGEGKVRAASAGLDRIWDGLGHLAADAFLDDAEADRALQKKLTVTLGGRSGGQVVVDLGGACPGHADSVVAVRRDERGRLSACVPRGALESLAVPAADLVDLRAFGAHVEEVIDLKLAGAGQPIAMARSGTQWHQQTPTDRMVDPDVGKAFAERLMDVTGARIVTGEAKALGLDPPRATVRVVSLAAGGGDGGDAERTELLEIGAEQGGLVRVRRVEDGAVIELGEAAVAPLLADETALRSRKVFDAAGAPFAAVRIEAPGRTQRLAKGEGGRWSLLEPRGAGLAVDMAALGDVTGAVGGLSAERWVGAARPEHGLDRPRLVVRAELEGDGGAGKKTLEVRLGAPAGTGGSFARTGDDPTVFVAPRRLEEVAGRWLVDRASLLVDVAMVRRATLRAEGGKSVTLVASKVGLHVEGAVGDPVANARAAAVRAALSDFLAESVVGVGPAAKAEGLDKPALTAEIELDGGKTAKLAVGAGDTVEGTRIHYVRREGVDATFAVAQARVRALFEAVTAGK